MKDNIGGFAVNYDVYTWFRLVAQSRPNKTWPGVLILAAYLQEKAFSDDITITKYCLTGGTHVLRVDAPHLKTVFVHKVIKPWVAEWAKAHAFDGVRVRCTKGSAQVYTPLTPKQLEHLLGVPSGLARGEMTVIDEVERMLDRGISYKFIKVLGIV